MQVRYVVRWSRVPETLALIASACWCAAVLVGGF